MFRIINMGLLIFISLTSSAQSLFSIIKTNVTEEYYHLSADNITLLHWKLKHALVKDNNGNKFIAKTDWDVAWKVHTLSDSERCVVSDVTVDVSIKYTYPKWLDIAFAPWPDRYLWNKFIIALRRHEEGHAVISKEEGTRIEKALLEVNPAANCKDLEVLVRNKADAIHQEYIAKEALYDKETMHGKNQGAILP